MDIRSINAFFFPTKVLFVDDDISYSRALMGSLSRQYAHYELSDDPIAVSHRLTEHYKPKQFLEQVISWPESDINSTRFDIDIKKIAQMIYNPDRFSDITVLVTDFSMPKKTGVQLCEALLGSPINRLMITSEADEKIAIDLLNRSIISKFIKKARPVVSYVDTLETMIQELQQNYFSEQSRDILKGIVSSPEHSSTCINKPEFIELFKQLFNENKVCEYYLLDTSGSFLFLSSSGISSYLLVHTKDDMRAAIQLLECSDDPNQAVLTALQKGEKILYWDTSEDFPNSAEDQLHHSYPAQKMGDYYYSYVTNQNVLNLDQDKIVSFQRFLKKQTVL